MTFPPIHTTDYVASDKLYRPHVRDTRQVVYSLSAVPRALGVVGVVPCE